MFTKTFRDWLKSAQGSNWALPHFNVSTADQLKIILEVAYEQKSPVIIGVSEGEADFLGYFQIRALIDSYKQALRWPIFLNADHHHGLERARHAIDAGFDGINIDLSLKSENDNLAETKAVVEYARRKNKNISVEGEIGALATQSSEINQKNIVISEESLTTPQQAKYFVDVTGVDRLTPAVGNFHGMVKKGHTPKTLRIDRIKEIKQAVAVPLTLHGGSGLSDEDLSQAAQLMSNIHINTELRVAYTNAVRKAIKTTTTPYKYLSPGALAMKEIITDRVILFGSAGKVK